MIADEGPKEAKRGLFGRLAKSTDGKDKQPKPKAKGRGRVPTTSEPPVVAPLRQRRPRHRHWFPGSADHTCGGRSGDTGGSGGSRTGTRRCHDPVGPAPSLLILPPPLSRSPRRIRLSHRRRPR